MPDRQVTEYKHFLDMNPLQFIGREEPLDADAWIRAIEAMFAVFTLPCTEGRKAKFAAASWFCFNVVGTLQIHATA
jgi:hypothetical protein